MQSQNGDGRGPRRARPGALWIAFVLAALPLAAVAVPRIALLPWSGSAERVPAARWLEALWLQFEAEHDPAQWRVEAFAEWVGGLESSSRLADLAPGATLDVSIAKDAVQVTVQSGSGGSGGSARRREPWRLEVSAAPWAAIDATVAAADLDCILCHTRVEGEQLVRVVSGRPYVEGVGADVKIRGKLEHAPLRLAAPDLIGALDAASFDPGLVTAVRGAVGPAAGTLLVEDRLRPVHIDGTVAGPVVLFGTEEQPVRIRGDAVIDGDLVLVGCVVGDGSLRVFGNVFLPGDVLHLGSGSLRLLVRGSVLAGEAVRPRRGESMPVTGGEDGSFSFLVESLARFNGARLEADSEFGALFAVRPGQPAPVLVPEQPALGHWRDPSLRRVRSRRVDVVGPSAGSVAGEPWLALDELWTAVTRERSLGTSPAGTHLDALFVVSGAFVAVAAGIDVWHGNRGTLGDGLDVPGEAPASLRLEGALIAAHASVHAPAGFVVRDDPVARSAVRLPASRGLVARLVGPEGAQVLCHAGSNSPRVGPPKASVDPLSVDPPRAADRLLRPAAERAATSR